MVLEKTAYWIAVGVLALFVNNHFAVRYEGEVHCLASRSLAAAERVTGHATRFMATAETMLGRGGARFAPTQSTLACAVARLASVQRVIAQHEAAMAQVQAEQARIVAMQQLRGTVICPRQNLRIAIPEPPRDGTI